MRDPRRPGHGGIATPWPDGAERWGDFRGRDAVFARLHGIESVLEDSHRHLDTAIDWSAGWSSAPDITSDVAAARAAIDAAVARVRAACDELARASRLERVSRSGSRTSPTAPIVPAPRGGPAAR